MLLLIGRVTDVDTRTAGKAGAEFKVTEVTLKNERGARHYVELGKDFRGPEPEVGNHVALQVSIKPWQGKNGARYSLTAWESVSLADLAAADASV